MMSTSQNQKRTLSMNKMENLTTLFLNNSKQLCVFRFHLNNTQKRNFVFTSSPNDFLFIVDFHSKFSFSPHEMLTLLMTTFLVFLSPRFPPFPLFLFSPLCPLSCFSFLPLHVTKGLNLQNLQNKIQIFLKLLFPSLLLSSFLSLFGVLYFSFLTETLVGVFRVSFLDFLWLA
jgi:hypothetical protein